MRGLAGPTSLLPGWDTFKLLEFVGLENYRFVWKVEGREEALWEVGTSRGLTTQSLGLWYMGNSLGLLGRLQG